MKKIVKKEELNLSYNFIKEVHDRSDGSGDRARVIFENGFQLSIIRGEGSYGVENGLFEIAPVNKNGSLDGSFLDKEDQGDDVLGYLTRERVEYYINKIGNLE